MKHEAEISFLATEVANKGDEQEKIQYPRHVRNPGLYFGYMYGFDAALTILKSKGLLTEEQVNELLKIPVKEVVDEKIGNAETFVHAT